MPNPAVLQTNTVKSSSGSDMTVSFASLPSVGNTVVVTVYAYTFGATFNPSCIDNQGNTYTRDGFRQDSTHGAEVAIFSGVVATSAGTFTVTVQSATTSDNIQVSINEVSGVLSTLPVDSSASNFGTSTSPAPGSITTGNAPDILWAVASNEDRANPATFTTPAGFTSVQKETNGASFECGDVAYQVLSSTGSFNPTWTTGNFIWSAVQVAYKGSGGTLTQANYRWRADDGGEATASWLASEGADITQPLATNTRLRLQLDSTADVGGAGYQVEYKKSTDSVYAKVLAAQPTTVVPTFVAEGTFTSGTAALTVPVPAGYQANDLFLLLVETANQAMATPTGWTQAANSPQSTGTAAAAGGVRLTVFYKVAGASESSVSLADSGDHQTAIIAAFRGVDPTTPIHLTAGKVDSAATASLSCPTLTTTLDNCLVVNAIALDKDLASTNTLSAVANATLSSLTKRHDQTVASGAGGGIAYITGALAAHGGTGATTATGDTSTTHAYLTLALAPVPVAAVPVLLAASANVAAGGTTATTAQLTPPGSKTTASFQAGEITDDTNPLPSLDLAADTWTELEWCVQAVSPAINGDVYQFRASAGGGALASYAAVPSWTVGTPGGPVAASPVAILGHL